VLTRRTLLGTGLAAPFLGLAGCARRTADPLRLMVPNAPGGGYDTTARILAGAMNQGREAPAAEVFNLAGAGGLVGLSRLVSERGNPDLMMMMGLGVVGAALATSPPRTLSGTTPLARLLGESEILLVRSGSPFTSFADVAEAWVARPGRTAVGGGSLPGGPDHLAAYAVAAAIDVPPALVDYRPYDGGGPLLSGLLRRDVDLAVTGVLESIDQVRSGSVRALAVTSARRVLDDVPTLQEQGVAVEFENWRGVLAPPGLTEADRERLIDLLATGVRSSTWRAAADRNGWTSRWLAGDQFGRFLEEEERRTATLLADATPGRADQEGPVG
jgi:putative tricarboxylic transport membrane protein